MLRARRTGLEHHGGRVPAGSIVTLTAASLIPLGPVLAGAGFYPASSLPVPPNSAQAAWATLTNITGLIAGVTRLGDKLSLLYSAETTQAARSPRSSTGCGTARRSTGPEDQPDATVSSGPVRDAAQCNAVGHE